MHCLKGSTRPQLVTDGGVLVVDRTLLIAVPPNMKPFVVLAVKLGDCLQALGHQVMGGHQGGQAVPFLGRQVQCHAARGDEQLLVAGGRQDGDSGQLPVEYGPHWPWSGQRRPPPNLAARWAWLNTTLTFYAELNN